MKVEVSAKFISIPRYCACCGDTPTTELSAQASKKRGNTKYTNSWSFPYCARCAGHVAGRDTAATILAVGVIVAFAFMFFIGWWSLAVVGLSIAIWIVRSNRAKSDCGPNCASSGAAVNYLGWHGTMHSFFFASRDYAAKFMSANLGKLINMTSAHHDLLNNSHK
jgi:hypothetical protein